MDWSKQLQDTIKTWTDSQKRLLEGVGKVVQQIPAPSTTPWEFSVDLWEKSVRSFLDAQREWLGLWIRGIGAVVNKPDQDAQWSSQAQEITRLTIEFQKLFWENWFFTLKQLDPIKYAGKVTDVQPLAISWTANMHRAIQLQEEWLQSAVSAQKPPTEETVSADQAASGDPMTAGMPSKRSQRKKPQSEEPISTNQ
jgi:hypothetical protein